MREKIRASERWFCAICWLVYFVSYLTRANFAAVIAEIVVSEGFAKSALGAVATASFVSYGAGQVVSGILGDKINGKTLILAGISATALFNVLMPVCDSAEKMTVVWCLNGFAQSFFWPPLCKIMSERLSPQRCKKAIVDVSIASAAGTVCVYMLSPLCIMLFGWRSVFFIGAGAATLMGLLWTAGIENIREEPSRIERAPQKTSDMPLSAAVFTSGLIPVSAAVLLQGMLKEGITTWMPSFINENFHLGTEISILTTVAVPVFTVVSLRFFAFLHKRFFKEEVLFSVEIFAAAFALCVLMALFYRSSVAVSIALSAMITGCMQGINLMLISMVPLHFSKIGKVSAMTGILNATSYVGCAASTYGFAAVSERFGWNAVIILWCAVTFLGAAFLLPVCRKWKKFKKEFM